MEVFKIFTMKMIENNKQNPPTVHSLALVLNFVCTCFKQFRQYKYLQTSIVNISFPNLPLLLNKNNKGTGKQPVIKSNRPEVFL